MIIGFSSKMNEDWVRDRLDECLLEETEMQAGPTDWLRLEDPFASWEPAFAKKGKDGQAPLKINYGSPIELS